MKTSSKQTAHSQKPTPDEKRGLETPVQFCPGVGPGRAKALENMGVYTVRDLFWHLPRGYEDFVHVTDIASLPPNGIATVVATVTYVESRMPRGRSRVRHILNATVKDDSGELEVVWFNQSYLSEQIKQGTRLRLHGKAEGRAPFMKMSSPKFVVLSDETEEEAGDILPLYPLSDKLTQGAIRKIVSKAMERFSLYLVEWMPSAILQEHGFPSRMEAFRILHAPQAGEGAPLDSALPEESLLFNTMDADDDEPEALLPEGEINTPWENARRRLVFEELFLHQFSLRLVQGKLKQFTGISHPAPNPEPFAENLDAIELEIKQPCAWPARFVQNLPFALTDEQRKVCREIQTDMLESAPMNRLLQGDVGSGKTVVSVYAMVLAAAGGCQAALMAPTELLAQQHAASIRAFTKTIPELQTVVLTGGMKAAERRAVQQALKTGGAQLVVGTHALFQEDVEFDRLGLVVVDEQHKFGVEQRERLVKKGEHPDLLAATATPIPRTLSLTVYGDMDISTIATLPPNRPEIRTRWTHWINESKVWGFVDEKIALGQQAYIVCPIIDPSETQPDLPSTEEAFEAITEKHLTNRRIALLHGRHSPQDKQAMMDAVRAGDLDAVVATTVIEVGVDLPNATIMVILGAERFGLAQLHQLRGRVGRGTQKSYCILITPERLSPYAEQRMRLMEATRDGFRIAEEDLKLRGPGEAFGTKQSGRIRFHLADPMRDGELLQAANQTAHDMFQKDPRLIDPAHDNMKNEILSAYGRIALRRPS
ncbi:MAG: ATP-dependent DNA helicase RecG [Candidatus Hinthialibacter antarcticus]|nr:ATP-dependent DNA helicase RecG [Candidatus Hinthialibacter antarcticus]